MPVLAMGSLRMCILIQDHVQPGHVAEGAGLDRLIEGAGNPRDAAVRHGDAGDDRAIVSEFEGERSGTQFGRSCATSAEGDAGGRTKRLSQRPLPAAAREGRLKGGETLFALHARLG